MGDGSTYLREAKLRFDQGRQVHHEDRLTMQQTPRHEPVDG
jgi:hypothetical protein